jgi:hypothetical protein
MTVGSAQLALGSAQMHKVSTDIPNVFNACDETTAQKASKFCKISLASLNCMGLCRKSVAA